MRTEPCSLSLICQSLRQLSEELLESTDPLKRLALLGQMRVLLSDADKIIGDEIGDHEEHSVRTDWGTTMLPCVERVLNFAGEMTYPRDQLIIELSRLKDEGLRLRRQYEHVLDRFLEIQQQIRKLSVPA